MPKDTPRTRLEIITRLHTERRRLEANLARLTPAEIEQPGVVGIWRIQDMLAHLAEWESFLPGWIAAARSGNPVVTPAPDLTWKQLDMLNERIFARNKERSLEEALAYFHTEHARFMQLVESLPDEEVLIPGFFNFTGKSPLYNWLAAYAAHDRWGKTEIRRLLKRRAVPVNV